MRNKKMMVSIVCFLLVMMFANVAYAAGPFSKFGAWVQEEAGGLFIGLVAVLGLYLLFTRKLMLALVVLLFAGVGGLLVFDPSGISTIMQNIISEWL